MADPTETKVAFRELLATFSPVSHRKWEVALKKINVHILEMEDALFHHNSAVMMPENPEGKSSAEGGGADQSQAKVSGVKALALVFKQFEFNPKQKIVLAGHTDTSGDAKYNFELSELRAQNVLYLLIGERTEWAKVCHKKQKVEDHQQILKWTFKTRKWPCNPGAVDNSWDTDTEKALSNFVQYYNTEFADKKGTPRLADDTVKKVKSDGQKRWPVELWEAAYDLYNDDLCGVLQDSPEQLDKRRKETIFFVEDSKPYVACGESFPIKDKEKSNYRSQANRRVEILFFDADEAPVLNCPKDISAVHKEKDCPLYHGYHFIPLYIDPSDLYAVMYHLSFKFYDRIANKLRDVPDGLTIVAIENGTEEIPCARETITKGESVVYALKLQFKTPLNDPNRKTIHFEFRTDKQWVFTENAGASPKLVTEDPTKITKLSFETRLKYYDLPIHWSSQNYWTRFDGNMATGERFEKVLKTDKKLKPFGTNVTAPDKPLLFSLDDIVLVNGAGSQILSDRDNTGAAKDLSEHSRLSMIHPDAADKFKLKVFKPRANAVYWSDVPFAQNLLTDTPPLASLVVFCNGFYFVSGKRTTVDATFDATKHVLGARAAMLNDAAAGLAKEFLGSGGSADITNDYVAKDCGHFDLVYMHGLAVDSNKIISGLLLYWNCRFNVDVAAGGLAADKTNFEQKGMENAMVRHTVKDYQLEKLAGPLDMIVKIGALFEAKLDTVVGATPVTRGGAHKCIVRLVSDAQGSSMSINTAKFRHSGYDDEAKPYGSAPGDPDDPLNNVADYDGSKTKRLTVAHELGHASGRDDEYVGRLSGFPGLPEYSQYYPGMPYSIDELSLMTGNHALRMRHFWGFVNWLHDEGKPGKTLVQFLNGTTFKLIHKDLAFDLTNSKYRNIYKPAFSALPHNFGGSATNDLLLYKLGDDEFARLLTAGQTYRGLLVVRTNVCAKFVDGDAVDPAKKWSAARRRQWLGALEQDLQIMLDKKYRLECTNAANDFANVHVRFMPHYVVTGGAAPAGTHFTVTVTRDGSTNFAPAGNAITVGSNVDNKKIICYFFGKTSGTADLTSADLSPLVDWIKQPAVANGPFVFRNQ
ncbi:MAG: OmpA family protein [Candidatus Zixiibacteriota bacterium]